MTLYLSRLTLNKKDGNAALANLLDPQDAVQAMNAHHALLWTVFSDSPDRRRDFLWRSEGNGQFLTLSRRKPAEHNLFCPHEIKEFSPNLEKEDHLGFMMRVNATRNVRPLGQSGKERKRVDVVMDAVSRASFPKNERAYNRMDIAQESGTRWLSEQGEYCGFSLEQGIVEHYSIIPLERRRTRNAANFGVLDISGIIRITNPPVFIEKLASGFGRAKAFGCGLMLIKRVIL